MQQIKTVTSFQELTTLPFEGNCNAICWERKLHGDFAEIVNKINLSSNVVEVTDHDLSQLDLSKNGNLAREKLLDDMRELRTGGFAPILNVIQHYERDGAFDFITTDVYSYHVDRSPLPTDTYLCTYYGDASDILANNQAIQKISLPNTLTKLRALFEEEGGDDFEQFLVDNFFDLHYEPHPGASPVNLGVGNMWRLATDNPYYNVLPCIHRAPVETSGPRLLMIC